LARSKYRTTFLQKILLIGLGLLILLIFELLLRISGLVDRASHSDPFVGFEKVYPLFGEKKLPDGTTICATNANKRSFFNYQEFPKQKPTNTIRIFCFGGSTTYGRPYRAETAFPHWLEINLNLIDPGHNYEVINAGGISYASYRIVHLVEEASRYQPDLFIFYMGHNEFLEARTYENILQQNPTLRSVRVLLDKLDLYVLLRNTALKLKNSLGKPEQKPGSLLKEEVATILDASAGLDRYTRETIQKPATIQHYRYNLTRMLRLAKKRHIKVVLATLTANLKDFSPFKSQHRSDLPAIDLQQWDEYYRQGQLLQQRGKFQQALAVYQKCLKIDDQYAELAYNIGQCMYQVEQFELAKHYYQLARELDVCPLRAPREINAAIRELAEQYFVPLVDIEAEFEKLSPHGIPGNDFLIDHVHPTIRGNQIIAETMVRRLQQQGIVPSSSSVDRAALESAYQQVLASLPKDYYVEGMLNLAKVLGWAGKEEEKTGILQRNSKQLQGYYEYHYMIANSYLRQGKLEQAIRNFKTAIRLNPGFSESYTNLGFALERSGKPDEALKNYQQSLSLDPGDYVAQANIARMYYLKGEPVKAIAAYKKAIQLKSDYPHAHEGLGVVYYQQGNIERALEELNLALQLNPNYAEAYYNIGLIYLDQRKIDAAIANFKKAIANNPGYADAYSNLGVCYYHKKMLDLAIKQLKTALEIEPRLAKAHNNLAIAYHSAGKYDLAWQHVQAAQKLGYAVHPQFIEMLRRDSGK